MAISADDSKRPGTILKIKAKDFVTYSKLSFCPSPLVNVLLAPNGAGKSSILSAIILGLGGKPNIIGKSNQISDFIKFGKDEARIRIDLYDEVETLSIGRLIKKNNSTVWYMNEKRVGTKEIEDVMKRLNIQVDSLCQVLPQERVQDFSKMNSLQLFSSIQKVVGGDLFERYTTLVELRLRLSELEDKIDKVSRNQQDQITKHTNLEKDVEAVREKQRTVRSVNTCRQKLAWLLYQEKQEELDNVSRYVEEAKRKLDDFESQLEPLKQLLLKSERKYNKLKETLKNKKILQNTTKDKMRKQLNQMKALDDQIACIKELRDRREAEASSLQAQIDEIDSKIQQLSNLLSTEDCDKLADEVKRIDGCIREKMREMQQTDEQIIQIKHEQVLANSTVRALERKLDEAKLVGRFRLNVLAQRSPAVTTAHDWVTKNRDTFQSAVYGPVLLEINMTLPEAAKYAEFIIPFRDLSSFVTEKSGDTVQLLRRLKSEEGLSINCAHCDPPERPLQELFPSPISAQHIKELGFDCYLVDLLHGPDTVLKHLCTLFKLHLIPIAFSSRQVNVQGLSQYKNIRMYFIEDNFYRVSISKYSGNRSESIMKIKPAKFLKDSIDKQLIRDTQLKISERRENLGELEGDMTSLVDTKASIQSQLNDLRNEKKPCAQRLEQFKSSTVRLRQAQDKRMDLLNRIQQGQRQVMESHDKIKSIVEEGRNKLVQVVDLCRDYSESSIISRLSEATAKSEREFITAKKSELETKQEGKQKLMSDYNELKISIGEVKAQVSSLISKAKEATEGLSMADKRFDKLFGKAFKSLPDDLQALKDKISLYDAKARSLDNPLQEQLLKEYEEAVELAEKLLADLAKLRGEESEVKLNFSTLLAEWEPVVCTLVQQINQGFSNFFRKMSCVGEVAITRPDNQEAVEKFGLEVKVKFHNDRDLVVMHEGGLSGGEKSLTTAVFLLSLQRLTSLPFRCVDELNQGMDQLNERRMYNLLFNTIADTSSQNFLLTPKFLKGVQYPDICTVYNIFHCPIYKMSLPSQIISSQPTQVFNDLDKNVMHLNNAIGTSKTTLDKENRPNKKKRTH